MDNLDRQVVKAITVAFGKQIWNRALVVLTHAQLSPPDGLNYDVFFSKRSEALMKLLRSGAGIKKNDNQVPFERKKSNVTCFNNFFFMFSSNLVQSLNRMCLSVLPKILDEDFQLKNFPI